MKEEEVDVGKERNEPKFYQRSDSSEGRGVKVYENDVDDSFGKRRKKKRKKTKRI